MWKPLNFLVVSFFFKRNAFLRQRLVPLERTESISVPFELIILVKFAFLIVCVTVTEK